MSFDQRELVHAALSELGVTRLLLAIHDASFPSDPDEDLGAGSPATRAAGRLFELVRSLGFTGVQLGPAGETSRGNASPYDAMVFSRAIASIPASLFAAGGELAELIEPGSLATGDGGELGDHRRAHDVTHALIAEAWSRAVGRAAVIDRVRRFRAEHAWWLERDALYAALRETYGGGIGTWESRGAGPLDATLWQGDDEARRARRSELARAHERSIEAYAFGQMIAHESHASVQARSRSLGLELYGDLQVGVAEADAWSYASAFLIDYAMGAPPSRTNLEGQAWNYPVLDPAKVHRGGAALELVIARVDKVFAEYDNLRIDHPHGLVCPWVYRRDAGDPAVAVRAGARLFESPDLPDHPGLARYAIVTPAQLDRSQARHADHWVRSLEPAQLDRYAGLLEAIVALAERHGRRRDGISCEVLSTMPLPLRGVLARHHLGRWRVFQKANLDDATDVYRLENAAPADWVMIGNHDTPSIFGLHKSWDDARRDRWGEHLVARLRLAPETRAALAEAPGLFATAMLAELFACRAENVMIFFADLFGYERQFNVPGTVADTNWSMRLPAWFAERYRDRLANGRALDLPLALALALRARGSRSQALIARLSELSGAGTRLRAAESPG